MRILRHFALVAFSLSVCSAQSPPPGDYGPGQKMSVILMLRTRSLQQELKATPEQARKLVDFSDAMMRRGRELSVQLRDMPAANSRAKVEELQRARLDELRKGLVEILKPEQIKRLEQIGLQQSGVFAFEMPHVLEALKLTDPQKGQIRAILLEMKATLRDVFVELQKDREAAAARRLEVETQTLAKCTALLTDEQKATWQDLTGEPFVIKVEGPAGN